MAKDSTFKVKVIAREDNALLVKKDMHKYRINMSHGQQEFCSMFNITKNSTVMIEGRFRQKPVYFGHNAVPCGEMRANKIELLK